MSESNGLSGGFDFDDVTPIEVRFELKVGGTKHHFLMREASEETSIRYQNAQMAGARFTGERVIPTVDAVVSAGTLLLSLCMFEVIAGEERKVDLNTIRTWPTRIVSKLVERIKKISGLNPEEDNEEFLTKQLKETQEKLDTLAKRKSTGEDPLKNVLGAGKDT